MRMCVLFPSDFFDLYAVDPDLRAEYEAVAANDEFEILLFGYDAWFNESRLVFDHQPDQKIVAIYRGWMMKPEQYDSFYQQLLACGIRLITNPKQYAQMHIFPNVYPLIQKHTPRIQLFELHEPIYIEQVKKSFDRFMVKDFVKSVKGTEFPAFFDQSITQKQFDHWMKIFYDYHSGLLTGGICIKEFVDLKRYGDRSNEYRIFYAGRQIVSISRNSGQPAFAPEPPEELIERYSVLPSPYYTLDVAELNDGSWKILEAGDGGVSGLSDHQDARAYFHALFHLFA